MLASEFEAICEKHSCLRSAFKGAFSLTELKRPPPVKSFVLWNASDGKGTHWRALFRDHEMSIEIFDSLGLCNSEVEQILSGFAKNISLKVNYNSTQLQPSTSDKCGWYCLLFCFERILNPDLEFLELIKEIFSDDNSINDNIVMNSLSQFNLT